MTEDNKDLIENAAKEIKASVEREIAKALSDPQLKGDAWWAKVEEFGLKPGQVIPGTSSWIPWAKRHLNPDDTVTFVCQDLLGSQGGNFYTDRGKAFILSVNDLTCSFWVGQLNTVNRFFYNEYEAKIKDNIALEEFKRHGPRKAVPWGENNWMYIPFASTFGLDIDGRALRDPKWYELDKDGIPVKINNMKKFATLYFEGDFDFTFTKAQLLELILSVYKTKTTNKIKKLLRRK